MSSAYRRVSCIDAGNTAYFLSIWTLYLMKYGYPGPSFRFIHQYVSVNPVRHEQYRRPEFVMDLVHCILGNSLVFTTLVARCLYVCKDAREPSGKKWNNLSKVCHVIMQKWRLSRHLCKCLLSQMYEKWETVTMKLSVRSMFSKKRLAINRYERVLKSDPLISRCGLRQLEKFMYWRSNYCISAENNREIWLQPT